MWSVAMATPSSPGAGVGASAGVGVGARVGPGETVGAGDGVAGLEVTLDGGIGEIVAEASGLHVGVALGGAVREGISVKLTAGVTRGASPVRGERVDVSVEVTRAVTTLPVLVAPGPMVAGSNGLGGEVHPASSIAPASNHSTRIIMV